MRNIVSPFLRLLFRSIFERQLHRAARCPFERVGAGKQVVQIVDPFALLIGFLKFAVHPASEHHDCPVKQIAGEPARQPACQVIRPLAYL